MKKSISLLLLTCFAYLGQAQHTLVILIKDAITHESLPGATARMNGLMKEKIADAAGILVFPDIADGDYSFSFRFVGYNEKTETVIFPGMKDTLIVFLELSDDEMGEVVITSTRSNRSIRNIPTRVEFLGSGELQEKANMRPGDIRMMLNESTGIQTQQISATSANSSIRIQGLDGRYTQILKDGFPLYAGFSGGLGLLQTPPLDLKQVEIIKGSSSTLYGGGAIAGMINLISRTPGPEKEFRLLTNVTSAGGLDVNGFFSRKFGKKGLTVYSGYSGNKAYDPSGTGFSAIPAFSRLNLNPKLFLYLNKTTTLIAGFNAGFEDRAGGDMQYLGGHGDSLHSYFEKNKSHRLSSQVSLKHELSQKAGVSFRNSVSSFKRSITIPGYKFDGNQLSGYSEMDYYYKMKNSEWVFGLNVYTDHFKEYPSDSLPGRNYSQTTLGIFMQHTWTVSKWLQTEAGLRGDDVYGYGFVFLPRVSALFRIWPALSSRIGAGLGYKTPTIFTEETERIQYRNVLPVSPYSNQLERSYGANWDFNYTTRVFGGIAFSMNQLFFFTRISDPLILETLPGLLYKLVNSGGYLDSKGFETNLRLGLRDFHLYIGYTFTDAHLKEGGQIRENPLTARHRLNNVLVYEKEGKLKLGLEAYYYSTQPLNDGTTGKPYWIFGFMAEKNWNGISLFINFENFTDTRQTGFDTIYSGTITHPVFRDIYAPIDGFVVNGGLKWRL